MFANHLQTSQQPTSCTWQGWARLGNEAIQALPVGGGIADSIRLRIKVEALLLALNKELWAAVRGV